MIAHVAAARVGLPITPAEDEVIVASVHEELVQIVECAQRLPVDDPLKKRIALTVSPVGGIRATRLRWTKGKSGLFRMKR